MWEIEFYEKGNKIPVQDFLDGLNKKLRAKAIRDIILLKELGTEIREPYSKNIGDNLFELRIKFSSDIARIFCFFFDGEKIILPNGFIKKSNKTPKKEIDKAMKYKREYFERGGKNEKF